MARFIFDTNLLAHLDSLRLLSRKARKLYLQGDRTGKRAGSGLEFIDYQQYQMGDDYRYIDWNLFSRLGELFTKLFIQEESLRVCLLIDQSGSMSTGSPPKIDYACSLAAVLGYIVLSNLDEVKGVSFSSGLNRILPFSRGKSHIYHLFDFLREINAEGETRFNLSLREFTRRERRTGMAIVLSDLLDPQGYQDGLLSLRSRGWEVTLIHILEEKEIRPPEEGEVVLIDRETHRRVETIIDESILKIYREQVREFLQEVESFCKHYSIKYMRCVTPLPFRELIFQGLRKKKILK